MDELQSVALAFIAVVAAIYIVRWRTNPLRAIPTVGGSFLPGLSYIVALRNASDVKSVLEEGYRKYPESAFKIWLSDRWVVVVSGKGMIEDIRKRPDQELSGLSAFLEMIQWKYTGPSSVLHDDWQVNVVKNKLTPMLPHVLPNIVDEAVLTIRDQIVTRENEWTSVEVMPALQKIVARVSNRAFVGLPLCRNEEYLKLAADFSVHWITASLVLRGFVPDFMKAIVAPFIGNIEHVTNLAVPHVRPIIEASMKALVEPSNDEPNDLLQFLPAGETVFVTTQRLFILNVAVIYPLSITIARVIYHLAESPELIHPLREEIRTIALCDGWTGTALGKMWKLDSILRETLRYHGINLLGMWRMAMKDITLADGTHIPRGTMVAANAYAQHHGDATLENARLFDPFRYERMRRAEGQDVKNQFTSTSLEYIPFGHGHHACPGRYFASNELKVILGHIILNYDLKLGGDGSCPSDVYSGTSVIPAPHGRVLFKKRERSG